MLSMVSVIHWEPEKTKGRLLCIYCLVYLGLERIESRIVGTLGWFLLQMARSLLQKA